MHSLKPEIANSAAHDRTTKLKTLARAEGFDLCQVAAAGPPDPQGNLDAWLSAGYAADMEWIARTREIRLDLKKRVPDAQSVVVVARNYYSERPDAMPGSGRVARYAWGRDYHNVLRKPLRRLAAALDALEDDARSYCSIDSSPVLERTWAERAGIGAIGKNSLVLNRELGSWFFLGVIVTTVRLRPDKPVADMCGTCTACIDACPTAAIVSDRVVDSRKCISYQTIENRGDIPDALHSQMDDWVFGCDVCQEVCPWNRFASQTTESDFLSRPGNAHPALETLSDISDDLFRKTFEGSPIRRAKAEGMRRNARIALENQSSSEASGSDTGT